MDDLAEMLARQIAEKLNGGEWRDGKWYTDGQRQAWRAAMQPIADRIEALEKALKHERQMMIAWEGSARLHLREMEKDARREALEEAARVAEDLAPASQDMDSEVIAERCDMIAAAIRALMEKE